MCQLSVGVVSMCVVLGVSDEEFVRWGIRKVGHV